MDTGRVCPTATRLRAPTQLSLTFRVFVADCSPSFSGCLLPKSPEKLSCELLVAHFGPSDDVRVTQ